MKRENGKCIRLYNEFREVGSEYHLSVDELYLYSVLRRLINYDSETVVNVDVLDQYTRNVLNLPYNKRDTLNKKAIRGIISSLLDKGVIHCDSEPTKNGTLLKITFAEMSDDLKHYESIPFEKFESFTNRNLFYIYFVVASWKGKKEGFVKTYKGWADILDSSKEKAEKYVNKAVDEGIIYVNVGDYSDKQVINGQKQRDTNTYSIYPFKEEDKTPAQKKKEQVDKPESVDDILGNKDYPFNTGNWLNFGRLDVEDYVIYLKNKDNKDFIADCKIVSERIKNKDKTFAKREKKMLEQAQRMIVDEKRKLQEQIKKDKVKDGKIIVKRLKSGATDPFDDEEVYLDNFNSVQIDDSIYFINHMGEMDTITASQLVTGWDKDMLHDFYNYSDSAKDELLYKLKKIVHYNGCFDINVVREEMEQVRKDFTHSYNKGMPYDVDWEGDRYHDDVGMEQPINISLQKRIREHEEQNKPTNNGGIKLDLR